ncbi:MAG: tetratricopeptide repeat protein, partial [Candidatus Rokubacteria bacterium]|nr:tetratricopeptide repeat protein [Candidatus Rokubacteria bacterium]
CLALSLTLLRDLGRSFRDYAVARRARREEGLAEIYHRGVDAQLAGKTAPAAEAFQALLGREPGHSEAHERLGELALARGDHLAALDHDLQALRSEERPDTLLAVALDYQRCGRGDEALAAYRRILQRDRTHLPALRGIRDLSVTRGRWTEALSAQQRLAELVPDAERLAELDWLAGIQYEVGKELLAEGKPQEALTHFKESVKANRAFLPALVAMGDAHLKAGDEREAIRTWERAAEIAPAPVLLHRLEQAYRAEGRPSRMIAVYHDAVARASQDLSLAFALGRVYFELEMLDEAADQFEKLEVRAPDFAPLHAYLGAIFERRGQVAEAFEEYRRALTLTQSFDWPHRCSACGVGHPRWQDRCPGCHRWNTSHP